MEVQSRNNIQQGLRFQLVFWISLFLFGIAKDYGQYEPYEFYEVVSYNLCHWVFQIIAANFIYFVLVKKFLDTGKYVSFTVYLILFLYVISVLNRIFTVYLAEPLFGDYQKDSLESIVTDLSYLFFCYVLTIVTGSFIFVSIMFMIRYKNEKEQTIKLLKEKTELELKSLKAQLNPHFLFNTLNNIYSLSFIDAGKTSESISRLSDILDYILYKGQKEWVTVSEELKIIDDYIELEKLRYDSRLKVNKIENVSFPNNIPPLIYLSLVENSFKHGAGKISDAVEINIFVETDEEKSVFSIENTCMSSDGSEKKGIGLHNIQEQLKLHYKDNFSFSITTEHNVFKVKLTTPAK